MYKKIKKFFKKLLTNRLSIAIMIIGIITDKEASK